MKLIVTGASGYVATEVIRQALSIPKIVSVVALARKVVPAPPNLGSDADASKLRSIIIDDYGNYPEDVRKELEGADACIWTVAITPSKSRGYPFEDVKRVCQDNALTGIRVMFEAAQQTSSANAPLPPFRFLYMSGAAAQRDASKKPSYMPEYCLMRGEAESQILSFAASSSSSSSSSNASSRSLEAYIVKPGLITSPARLLQGIGASLLHSTIGMPKVDVGECAAAMLQQVMIDGSEDMTKDTLENEDLVRIGRACLNDKTKAKE